MGPYSICNGHKYVFILKYLGFMVYSYTLKVKNYNMYTPIYMIKKVWPGQKERVIEML